MDVSIGVVAGMLNLSTYETMKGEEGEDDAGGDHGDDSVVQEGERGV